MKIKKELHGLVKSFNYALRGLKGCILSERNMRIHIIIAAYVLIFSLFYSFTKAEYVILLLTIGSIIACEMLNTSIEAIVDMVSPNYNKLAQIAKDIAAGAVFVVAFFGAIIGWILFFDLEIIAKIINFFSTYPILIIALALSAILSIAFIFKGIGFMKKKGK